MDKDQIIDWLNTVITGSIGLGAVLVGLYLKGLSAENLVDAIKEIATFAVTISVVLYGAKKIVKSLEDPLKTGSIALGWLQKKYNAKLSGPKYNREDYDSEKSGSGLQYLFVEDASKGKSRAPLVPLDPLKEGILEIRVSKRTLVLLNIDSEVTEIQKNIYSRITSFLEKKYTGKYEIIPTKNERCSIIIDFDENELKLKKYKKALIECCEIALEELGVSK